MTQKCITHTLSLSPHKRWIFLSILFEVGVRWFFYASLYVFSLTLRRPSATVSTNYCCLSASTFFLSVIPVIIVCFLCSVQPGFTLCMSVGCLVYLTVCPSVCRLFSLCFICLPPFSHVLFLYVWAYLWIVFLALKFAVEYEALPPLPLALRIWYNAAMYWLLFFSCSVHFFCQRCILFFAFTHSYITYLRTYKLNTYVCVGISTCDKTLFGEFMRKLSSVWVLRLFCHPSNDSWHIFWQVSPRVQRQKYQSEIDWATNE